MRARRLIAAIVLVALVCLAVPASASAGPLDSVGDVVDDVTGFVDPFGGAGPNVQDALGGAAKGILDLIANAMLDGASWLLGAINSLIDSTTQVRITGISTACERGTSGGHSTTYPASCYEPVGWFGSAYGSMWTLAALFALGVIFIAAIDAVMRGQTHELLRLPLRVLVAFALTAAAIAVIGMLLQLTDEMSDWIGRSGGKSAGDFFASSQHAIEALKGDDASDDGDPAPVFVRMLVALAMALGSVVVWMELLLRASAIFVGVFFLPFAIAATVWPRTAPTFKRTAEILLALVFSKFGVVAVVALGGRALVAADDDVGQGLAGAAILLLACLMPILFLHMVHFAEGAWAMGAAVGAGAQVAVATPTMAARGATMMAIASRNWGGRALNLTRSHNRTGSSSASGIASASALRLGGQTARAEPSGARASGTTTGDGPARSSRSESGAPAPPASRPSTSARLGAGPGPQAPPTRESRAAERPPTAPSTRERETGPAPQPPQVNPATRPPRQDPLEDEAE